MSHPIDLFNIYNNLIEFVNYRKMELHSDVLDKSEFELQMNDKNYIKMELNNNTIIILFNYNENINNKFVSDVLKKNKDRYIIFITNTTILKTIPVNCENHLYKRFKIIIPKHKLVPKYKILSPEEREILKNEWLIASDNMLQAIYSDDAMMVWLGGKPGDIVSEENYINTGGIYVSYLLVKERKKN